MPKVIVSKPKRTVIVSKKPSVKVSPKKPTPPSMRGGKYA